MEQTAIHTDSQRDGYRLRHSDRKSSYHERLKGQQETDRQDQTETGTDRQTDRPNRQKETDRQEDRPDERGRVLLLPTAQQFRLK